MNPNKLRNRATFIEGKPLKNRAQVKTMSRRDPGKISPEAISDPEDKFETFFDYEEELSGLKSSSEQFQQMVEDSPSMEMEEISLAHNNNLDNLPNKLLLKFFFFFNSKNTAFKAS